jgi:hypothetical protein
MSVDEMVSWVVPFVYRRDGELGLFHLSVNEMVSWVCSICLSTRCCEARQRSVPSLDSSFPHAAAHPTN